ncbi:MAG TPA: radical SAM family heme chaperone HemW, partial [Chitinophagaceae bacterium]
MPGIYIHIPFCRKACHYCNFHFSATARNFGEMTEAIIRELQLRKHYLEGPVETIYFGGGTPSLLETGRLEQILDAVNQYFKIEENPEVTLEANPDDISVQKLQEWKSIGINRLSIGVQSFADIDLEWMNRAHNSRQAVTALNSASRLFPNITIDLIYGTPTLSDEQWLKNLEIANDTGIAHLSCYALTVEKGTALDTMIRLKKKTDVDQEKQARHFELLMQWAVAAEYEHYEISNLAKPGFRSRHNTSYWKGSHYLGLGPSAHSFNGTGRQWNISNNALYLKSIQQNTIPAENEVLSETQRLNEYIMTSLRTIEGLSLM